MAMQCCDTLVPVWGTTGGGGSGGEVLTETMDVYVSTTGDDVTGTGTEANPWRTVAHALREMPQEWYLEGGPTALYRVRMIAPYSGPLGNIVLPFRAFSVPASGAAKPTMIVHLQGWTSGAVGATTDARWTVIAGPLTPTAAALFAGDRVRYTMAAGTILANDQWLGELVRVHQGAAEIGRGWVIRSTAATQELLIQLAQVIAPAATNAIRIVEPSCVLGGVPGGAATTTSELSTPETSGVVLQMETVRCVDTLSLRGGLAVFAAGSQFVAPGGGGAVSTSDNAVLAAGNVLLAGALGSTALIGGTVLVRTALGVCVLGTISLLTGAGIIGEYVPMTAPPFGNLRMALSTTIRGRVEMQSRPRGTFIAFGGTAARPILLIPRPALPAVALGLHGTAFLSGFFAVDAAASSAGVVLLSGDADMDEAFLGGAPARFVPADAAVPALAGGFVVDVVRDGLARVNLASTLAGVGGDVQAGGNAALTWAALGALVGDRDNDLAVLASVFGG